MNWINVRQRLPSDDPEFKECDEYYLVAVKGQSRPKVGIYSDQWVVSSYGADTPEEQFYDHNEITHWMKAPIVPEKKPDYKNHYDFNKELIKQSVYLSLKFSIENRYLKASYLTEEIVNEWLEKKWNKVEGKDG